MEGLWCEFFSKPESLITYDISTRFGGYYASGNYRVNADRNIKVKDVNYTTANGINPNPLFNFIHLQKPIVKDRSLLPEINITKSVAIDFKTNPGKQYVIVMK